MNFVFYENLMASDTDKYFKHSHTQTNTTLKNSNSKFSLLCKHQSRKMILK